MTISGKAGPSVWAPGGALLTCTDNVCRRVTLDMCGHRSGGGDLLLDIPLFYGHALP